MSNPIITRLSSILLYIPRGKNNTPEHKNIDKVNNQYLNQNYFQKVCYKRTNSHFINNDCIRSYIIYDVLVLSDVHFVVLDNKNNLNFWDFEKYETKPKLTFQLPETENEYVKLEKNIQESNQSEYYFAVVSNNNSKLTYKITNEKETRIFKCDVIEMNHGVTTNKNIDIMKIEDNKIMIIDYFQNSLCLYKINKEHCDFSYQDVDETLLNSFHAKIIYKIVYEDEKKITQISQIDNNYFLLFTNSFCKVKSINNFDTIQTFNFFTNFKYFCYYDDYTYCITHNKDSSFSFYKFENIKKERIIKRVYTEKNIMEWSKVMLLEHHNGIVLITKEDEIVFLNLNNLQIEKTIDFSSNDSSSLYELNNGSIIISKGAQCRIYNYETLEFISLPFFNCNINKVIELENNYLVFLLRQYYLMVLKPDIKGKYSYSIATDSMITKKSENFFISTIEKVNDIPNAIAINYNFTSIEIWDVDKDTELHKVMFSPGYSKMTFIIDSFIGLWSANYFMVIDVITGHIVTSIIVEKQIKEEEKISNVNIIKKNNNQVIVYISNSSKVYTILL